MKKIFTILTSLVLILGLAGCSKEEVVYNSVTGEIEYVTDNSIFLFDHNEYLLPEDNQYEFKIGDKVTITYDTIENQMKKDVVKYHEFGELIYTYGGNEKFMIKDVVNCTPSYIDVKDAYLINYDKEKDVLTFSLYDGSIYKLTKASFYSSNYDMLENKEFVVGDKYKISFINTKIEDKDYEKVVGLVKEEGAKTNRFVVFGKDKDGILLTDMFNKTNYYALGNLDLNVGDTFIANFKDLGTTRVVTPRYVAYEASDITISNINLIRQASEKQEYKAKVVENGSDYVIVELDGKYYELVPEYGYIFNNEDYKINGTASFMGSVINDSEKSDLKYNGLEVGIINGVYYLSVR